MRLLQLRTGEDRLLDLHPQVSVVRSLDPDVRAQLVSAVTGLARNEACGRGLLEAHGILFDLDPALLSLLDRRVEVDPVVRAADLPGGAGVDEAALRARQADFEEVLARVATAVEAQHRAAAEVDAAAAALGPAQKALDAAAARRREAEARADAARLAAAEAARRARKERKAHEAQAAAAAAQVEHERSTASERLEAAQQAGREASTRLEALEAHLEQLGSARALLLLQQADLQRRVDEDALTRLEAARAELLQLRDRQAPPPAPTSAATPPPDPPGEPAGAVEDPPAGSGPVPAEDDPADRAEALAARLAVTEELLDELDRLDPAPVQAALADARARVDLVPVPEAADLADELEVLVTHIASAEAAGVPDLSAEAAAAVAQRLDEARAAVADAEDVVRADHLTPEDAIALESAHAALHDAIERAESRFGGMRARNQIERLRAEEQALLDRFGFVTYAEYLMGTSPAHRDPQAETALAEARDRLVEAERAWTVVEQQREVIFAHAQLLDRRRALVALSAELLGRPVGPDEDVVGALRHHAVPSVTDAERARLLADALLAAGLEVDPADLDLDDLEAIAEAWLEEAGTIEERRRPLQEARDDLRAALEQASEAAPPTEAQPPAPAASGSVAGPDPGPEAEAEVALPEGPAPSEASGGDPGAGEADAPSLHGAWAALQTAQDRWEAHETARAVLAGCDRELAQVTGDLEEVEVAVEAARAAVRSAEEAMTDAAAALAAVDRGSEAEGPDPGTGSDPDPPSTAPEEAEEAAARAEEAEAEAARHDADAAHRQALGRLEAAEREVGELTLAGEAVAADLERLQELHRASTDASRADPAELEWYLVARVAAQRSVSVAGSTPLLIEDPFGGLPEPAVHHLLGRLERVAETVQLIVVSDRPAVRSWVAAAGEARASLVEPSPA